MYFGVYVAMPVVFHYCAIRESYRGVSWGRLALGMILLGVLVWGIPNTVSYTVAQFMGWRHGRFSEGRGPEIAATAIGKVLTGAKIGFFTSIAGSVWSIVWSTILIWPHGKFGKGATMEAKKPE